MFTQEQTVEIRVLARQGRSIRSIAKELNISRQTVRRYLESSVTSEPRYGPRLARPSKLDPFKAYLQDRIAAARPQWIMASVLHREIVELGFTGATSIVRAWVAQFKPAPKPDPIVRFETEPGQQMQADFTIIRKGAKPLMALVATMGFSRASFARFTVSEDADTLVDCLKMAFDYFGGVPNEVLFDNAKSVIIARDFYGQGQHRWNDKLLALADQTGFKPRVCRPYRARTKGKVERFNQYLKTSYVLPLQVSLKQAGLQLDCSSANAHLGAWLNDVANVRVHATTGLVPLAQLVIERAHLGEIPPHMRPVAPQPVRVMQTVPPSHHWQHDLAVYDELLEA